MSDQEFLQDMVTAYIDCALWSGLDWTNAETNGNPDSLDDNYSADDISDEAMVEIEAECSDFFTANRDDLLTMDAGQAGHDFFLTRNHHGAGFWDRGLGDLGKRLTDAAHVYGTSELEPDPDGKLYLRS